MHCCIVYLSVCLLYLHTGRHLNVDRGRFGGQIVRVSLPVHTFLGQRRYHHTAWLQQLNKQLDRQRKVQSLRIPQNSLKTAHYKHIYYKCPMPGFQSPKFHKLDNLWTYSEVYRVQYSPLLTWIFLRLPCSPPEVIAKNKNKQTLQSLLPHHRILPRKVWKETIIVVT